MPRENDPMQVPEEPVGDVSWAGALPNGEEGRRRRIADDIRRSVMDAYANTGNGPLSEEYHRVEREVAERFGIPLANRVAMRFCESSMAWEFTFAGRTMAFSREIIASRDRHSLAAMIASNIVGAWPGVLGAADALDVTRQVKELVLGVVPAVSARDIPAAAPAPEIGTIRVNTHPAHLSRPRSVPAVLIGGSAHGITVDCGGAQYYSVMASQQASVSFCGWEPDLEYVEQIYELRPYRFGIGRQKRNFYVLCGMDLNEAAAIVRCFILNCEGES